MVQSQQLRTVSQTLQHFTTGKNTDCYRSLDASSTTSIQKLGNTRTRVLEAKPFPICPQRSNPIAPNPKRRHKNCFTCRHDSLARVGICTSELSSPKHQVHHSKSAFLILRVFVILLLILLFVKDYFFFIIFAPTMARRSCDLPRLQTFVDDTLRGFAGPL